MLSVKEIYKSANERCKHLTGGRCGIYQTRPNQCKEFVCSWLDGSLPKSQAPHKTGCVIWESPKGLQVVAKTERINPRTWEYIIKESYKTHVNVQRGDTKEMYRDGRKLAAILAVE